jgi:hypothetical protein
MSNSILKPIAVALILAVAPLSISSAQAAVKVGSYIGIWSAKTSYAAGDLITLNNKTFLSLVARNLNKNPDTNPASWQLLGGVGATGLQGPIGAQGIQGLKGDAGAAGINGSIGPKGDTGLQGLIGLTGLAGTVGPKGDSGLTGATGATGTNGADGVDGAVGPKGDTGLQGLIGLTGAKGDSGLQGLIGDIGAKGDTGVAGTNGLDGTVGPKGDTGLQGLIGLTGAKGDSGLQGLIGDTGDTGAKGDTGVAGTNGLDGADGPKGDIGLQGPAGADSTVVGPVGPRGPAGIPTSGTDVGDMQYWDGTNWVMIPAPSPLPAAPVMATLNFCNGKPTWATNCLPDNTTTYHIGDTGQAGGIVFYVTDAGLHGLEAAPIDQSTSEWGCEGSSISGAQGTAIGTGAANTTVIVAGCNVANTAAKVADAYALNGYNDWFLPSKDELNQMYWFIGPLAGTPLTNVGGFNVSYTYWSSSEIDATLAWTQRFVNGLLVNDYKYTRKPVRAIRAF